MNAGRFRALFSGSVGNLVEWYDWYVYSAFSVYFAASFFPKGDRTTQLLNAAAVFALGFLVRPLGGWLLGLYADRRGRRAALMLSVALMCGGSLLIAVTPTYAQIGLAAPALLLLARLLQGLSLGGEYGSSATYLSEVAAPGRRGFAASFQYFTLVMGQLLALGVLMLLQRVLLTEAQIEAWGWRIPFVIGAACALVALYLRGNLEETTNFLAQREARRGHLAELLRHWRECLLVLGLTLGGTVAFYTYTTYMQKFLVNTAGFSRDDATLVNAATLAVFMFLQPVLGALSDRIGRRPLLIGFGVGGLLFTWPLMNALAGATTVAQAFWLILAALTIVSGYTSINAIVKAELFPVRIRALGVALPYAIAVSVFGGTAEYLALWFKSIGRETWFYVYVSGCIGISLVVYLAMRDTLSASRIERELERREPA
jgi:MFS transporter, MHS family, alpha-ketoglutarate permease